MENRPVINLAGASPAPGADVETWNRYEKWMNEVYIPMVDMKLPGTTGIDRYLIIKENFLYPSRISIRHFQDLKTWDNSNKLPERIAIQEEMASWVKRHVIDYIWATPCTLVKSFRSEPAGTVGIKDTKIENAPIMHIEGYHLRPDEAEQHSKWLNEYGFNAFVPLFVGLPGLRGYDCFENTGLTGLTKVRECDYPQHLSILYFENIAAFENYEKSRELVAFQKAIANIFPSGLNYRWYVQYQLTKSWRK